MLVHERAERVACAHGPPPRDSAVPDEIALWTGISVSLGAHIGLTLWPDIDIRSAAFIDLGSATFVDLRSRAYIYVRSATFVYLGGRANVGTKRNRCRTAVTNQVPITVHRLNDIAIPVAGSDIIVTDRSLVETGSGNRRSSTTIDASPDDITGCGGRGGGAPFTRDPDGEVRRCCVELCSIGLGSMAVATEVEKLDSLIPFVKYGLDHPATTDDVAVGIEGDHGVDVRGRHFDVRVAKAVRVGTELGHQVANADNGPHLQIPELPRHDRAVVDRAPVTSDGADAFLDMATTPEFDGHRHVIVDPEHVDRLIGVDLARSKIGGSGGGRRYGDEDGEHYCQQDSAAGAASGDSGGGHSRALSQRWDDSPVTTSSSCRDYRSVPEFCER